MKYEFLRFTILIGSALFGLIEWIGTVGTDTVIRQVPWLNSGHRYCRNGMEDGEQWMMGMATP